MKEVYSYSMANGKAEGARVCFIWFALLLFPPCHSKHLVRLQDTSAKGLLQLHLVGFELYL